MYILDTNIFIDAKNRYYDFQVCPGFWSWLIQSNEQQHVFSIERVLDELTGDAEDDLSQWAIDRGDDFFLPVSEGDLTALGTIAAWTDAHQQYSAAAKATFFDCADYYLVAQAMTRGAIVVTNERPANSIQRVKIPNVCIAHGVNVMTPWEMLRREGAQFVLQEPQPVADLEEKD